MFTRNSALLLLAVQTGWDEPYWGQRNNPDAEQRMADLVKAFRARQHEVIHVAANSRNPNSPLYPKEPGHAFKPETAPIPGEKVFWTPTHCAFTGTDLEAYLRKQNIARLILAGFSTSRAVSSTARVACDLGFKTVVASDACVAFQHDSVEGHPLSPQTLHEVCLAELHGEFAVVLPVSALLPLL